MLDIIYFQNGRGKSGHCLQDLFSSVTLACALDVGVAYHPSWDRQSILGVENIKSVLNQPAFYGRQVNYACREPAWPGITLEEFDRIRRFAEALKISAKPTQLVIHSVIRVHLSQLHDWELAGLAHPGSFSRALSMLRQMYWGKPFSPKPGPVRDIAIHVRRGNIMLPNSKHKHRVWDADFYAEVIGDLRQEFPQASIRVFTQKWKSEDLDQLIDVEINRGGPNNATEHFRCMANADLLVPSNSCYSYWLALLCIGQVRFYGSVDFLNPDLPMDNFVRDKTRNKPPDARTWTLD